MALEPGRDRAGVRVALAAAATGIAMMVAVLTFTTSLGYLLRDPQLYGWAGMPRSAISSPPIS
jgi:hypothetical protein